MPENDRVVTREEYLRDPGATLRLCKEGPVTVLGANGEPFMVVSNPGPMPDPLDGIVDRSFDRPSRCTCGYMAHATTHELHEEINIVAGYAQVETEFFVTAGPTPETSMVTWSYNTAGPVQVETDWCMGNVKRLADACSLRQILEAIALSRPGVRGVSDKSPSRE